MEWSDKSGNSPATLQDLEVVFGKVVTVVLGFAGIVFFILLLSSGIKFITSGGDPKALEGARKTLTFAVGGLVVILLSFLILALIEKLTGINVTTFKVTQ